MCAYLCVVTDHDSLSGWCNYGCIGADSYVVPNHDSSRCSSLCRGATDGDSVNDADASPKFNGWIDDNSDAAVEQLDIFLNGALCWEIGVV
ncbi:hypothetical protein OR221_1893 [Microbacterium laevaniformans OR221]|nr:hypothetical protein OR221_1893 [Microbacterium laevaniformans OR221]